MIVAMTIFIFLVRVVRARGRRTSVPSPIPVTFVLTAEALAFGLIEAAFLQPEASARLLKDPAAGRIIAQDLIAVGVTGFVMTIVGGVLIQVYRRQRGTVPSHDIQPVRHRLFRSKISIIVSVVFAVLVWIVLIWAIDRG
jgi:hypothetical protein